MHPRLRSARDVQNGVDVSPVKTRNEAAGILGGGGDEFHAPAVSLFPELRRNRSEPYAPVPMISWLPLHGMSSSADSGVCP
jgi:hypothetical protein